MLIPWEKRRQRVWTSCSCCLLCLTTLMDTFRAQKASITATQSTGFLLHLSDGICTVHVGRGGDSSSIQDFTAKQRCHFLLVRVLVYKSQVMLCSCEHCQGSEPCSSSTLIDGSYCWRFLLSTPLPGDTKKPIYTNAFLKFNSTTQHPKKPQTAVMHVNTPELAFAPRETQMHASVAVISEVLRVQA